MPETEILKPQKIEKGDTIGIVGLSSPVIKERLAKGIGYLQKQGYPVKLGKHLYDEYGYLAGKDTDRAADLNQMFLDPEVKAIFCTRGGYGIPRLLELVDYVSIRKNPKILVGYSDVTALQLAIFAKSRMVTFSGPMVAVEMGRGMSLFTETHFWNMITKTDGGSKLVGQSSSLKALKRGKAEGRLLGGCLSLLCSLLGTPFFPDFRNAILFIEDVGEEPYRIDRHMTQLKLAGVFNQINGIVLGQFEDCIPKTMTRSLTLEQIIQDLTSDLNIPIVGEFPYGHIEAKYTMPLGVRVFLDGENGFLEILEGAVV